ncbi:hypothetical protein RchiOBHm_Chr1g0320261 [Rosa chinensis]|uniref:Uncharacterized protein n=1 Tax=Rosa chinensis TaxID=74649 RepID=A0A2P6S8L6_ROSCH|nr:hypothetical protein RchiOBHm_Chr1g0320261 [Rosa chinensis]
MTETEQVVGGVNSSSATEEKPQRKTPPPPFLLSKTSDSIRLPNEIVSIAVAKISKKES